MINAFIIRIISAKVAGSGGYYGCAKRGYGVRPALFAGFSAYFTR
ncbi:hypothetical protein OXIME_000556 [Oxyplasma meridianum]|uniref:Uncharacterized protein n=1 Tax=Oxyplasma meridianum TaxID=3073602 RepID=A0AAX4NGV1_9ARCH